MLLSRSQTFHHMEHVKKEYSGFINPACTLFLCSSGYEELQERSPALTDLRSRLPSEPYPQWQCWNLPALPAR